MMDRRICSTRHLALAAALSALLFAGCGGGDPAAPATDAAAGREQALRGGGGKPRTVFATSATLFCSGSMAWSVTLEGFFQSATIAVYAMPGVSPVGPFAQTQTLRTATSLPTNFSGTFVGLDPAAQYNVLFRRFTGGEGKIDEEVWVPTGPCVAAP